MPAMSVQDMIAAIRDLADDESENTHSDDELLVYINGAVGYYDSILAVHAKTTLMQARTLTHDGSELQAVMPYLPRIVSVERTSEDPRIETAPLERGFADRFPYISTSSESGGGYYYIQNNQLGIVPQQTTGTEKVWVILKTPELHYGTADAASTTTSLVLDSSPTLGNIVLQDDVYNIIPIMLTVERDVSVIADYDEDTVTCTLQFAFQNDPASAVYSLLPTIDDRFHWLYVYHSVIHNNIRTEESNFDVANERERLEASLYENIRKNQIQRNRYITRYGWS